MQIAELLIDGAGVGLLVAVVWQLATIKEAAGGLRERVTALETWRQGFPWIHT